MTGSARSPSRAESQPAGLSVRAITVRYGDAVALDELSLDVATGETVAVIGPSGSGKSTLLRAIAGLEPLAAGAIAAGGRPLEGVATHRRDLGLMFQDHALFPHLSVADNVAFGLDMKGWPPRRRVERVAELLDLVGMTSFGERPISQLSGGEAQRVALARALAPEPALLMLDEPFGSLDRVLRDQLTVEVGRLLDELGQTAVHVTHDQAEAFALADRVAVLNDGRLEQEGEPATLWHEPATPFVAEFLGHPNRWSVRVEDGSEPSAGAEVWFGSCAIGRGTGLAPGWWQVVVPLPALSVDPEGVLPVVVERAVFDRGRYRVDAVVEESEGAAAAEVVYLSPDRPARGQRVRLAVALDRLHPLGSTDASE